MSIRIRVSTGWKESTKAGNGEPTFGSYSAGAAISFEMDPSLMSDPAAFVAKIREHYALCEGAMAEELARLKAKSNGHAPAAAGPAAGKASPPAQPAKVRQPVVPPAKRATPARVAEEMRDYQEEQAEGDLPEDPDPPMDGKHLLGWARNQESDAKGWLIGLGRKCKFPNRILNWTPKQVQFAYDAFRQAHRS